MSATTVANEANALNTVVPQIAAWIQSIFGALNTGQITTTQATQFLDQTQGQYENLVYRTFSVKQKAGNGPDLVEKNDINAWVTKAKALITGGKAGSFVTNSLGAHAGFQGLPSFSVSYQPAGSDLNVQPDQVVTLTNGDYSWLTWVLVGLAAWFLVAHK
jgi:hypothetical protein